MEPDKEKMVSPLRPLWAVDPSKPPGDRYATPRVCQTYRNREWFARQLERGKTLKEIARAAGVSVSTVFMWKYRHQIGASQGNDQRGHLSDHARATYANRAWLIARIEEGKTHAEIALLARISRGSIISWSRRHGLTRGTRIPVTAFTTYANRDWLTARVGEGLTDREIAKQCRCMTTAIWAWRHRFGIPRRPRRNGPFPKVERLRRAFGEWLSPRLSELQLPERDVLVLKAAHGIGGAVRTHADVGRDLGLTRARAQQIHHKALRKIVAAVGADALKDFPKIAALPPHMPRSRGRHLSPLARETYADPVWLRMLTAAGLTDAKIAAQAGCSHSNISHWRRKFGIPPSNGQPTSRRTPS